MNGRSGVVTFFLFVFLGILICLQFLGMVQSDRLYDRLNDVVKVVENARFVGSPASSAGSGDMYPGDKGDWLVQHVPDEPPTLNPIVVEGTISTNKVVIGNVFERLFEYNLEVDKVDFKPHLAEKMGISDDGLEVTISLRDDIYFSDGMPVTADDVLFTYNTIMDPGVDAANLRNYYYNFKGVEKIDDRTVKFSFKELYWKTLESVAIFEVLPKHIYEYDDPMEFNKHRTNPVGSGPYVFDKWDVGQQIVLKRNEKYWGKKPKIDRLVFRIITNDKAALQALRAGEIDTMEPTAEQFADMENDNQFLKDFDAIKYWEPSVPYFYIGWNQARDFFKDEKVRLAMTHLVDREAIVNYLMKGHGAIVTGPFYVYGAQNDPSVKPWPYDIERAKKLLDEAGWVDTDGDGIRDKDGVKFSFKYSYASGRAIYEQLAKMLKDAASKVGIEVRPDPYEWSILIGRLTDGNFDAVTLGWGGTIESDPFQIFHSSQIEDRGSNRTAYNSPAADELMDKARRTIDEEKRIELYQQLHKLFHKEQPYTFLMTRPTFLFIHKRFENVILHKLGVDPFEWYVPRELQRY